MKLTFKTTMVVPAVLIVLLLVFGGSAALAATCSGDDADCFEANAEADSGDTGDTGDTGDAGDGGGGGDSGAAAAGDGDGGPGGSAGPGGNGGGNGGNGGGGGAAGGSGNFSGATIENPLKTSSTSAGQGAASLPAAGITPSVDSSAASSGGGGGGTSSSSLEGAEAGGAGGTYCVECSITLGGADMVNVSSWQLEGAPPSIPSRGSPGEPKENFSSALFLAGLLLLVVFAKVSFSPLEWIASRKRH